jgi:UDP-glucose 4-epimerase
VRRRALVTGGAGFIGSHICDLLLANGWDVEIIDDLSSGKRENVPSAARLHELDVRAVESTSLVSAGGFDLIVHLAAQIDVRRSVADPLFDVGVNVAGTLNLLEALRNSSSPRRTRFVLAATGGARYGDAVEPPAAETAQKQPDSPYGVAKLSAEYYLAYYARIHGLDTAAVRFGNVYGPRQDPNGEAGVVAIFCGRILDGKSLLVYGDGTQTRDYVHVTDVAAATCAVATADLPEPGGVDARAFNVGTGVGTSVLDLSSTLLTAAGASAPIEFAPKRAGEVQDAFLSVDKARTLIGWSPRIPLEKGLAETFRWFAARHASASSRS